MKTERSGVYAVAIRARSVHKSASLKEKKTVLFASVQPLNETREKQHIRCFVSQWDATAAAASEGPSLERLRKM